MSNNNKIYIDFVRTKALEKDEKKVLANKEVIVSLGITFLFLIFGKS